MIINKVKEEEEVFSVDKEEAIKKVKSMHKMQYY